MAGVKISFADTGSPASRLRGAADGFFGVEDGGDLPAIDCPEKIERIDAAVREFAVAEELILAPYVGNGSVDRNGWRFGEALDDSVLRRTDAAGPLLGGSRVCDAVIAETVQQRTRSHGGEDFRRIVSGHAVEHLLRDGEDGLFFRSLSGERRDG
jgi:hypothetical protein